MLRITISRRGSPEHVFDLRDQVLRIGRGAGNEILLRDPDKTVSRTHGRIVRTSDGYVYVDQASQNGSWVNGRVVDHVPLADGLVISLGEYELRCEARDVAALGPNEETMAGAGRGLPATRAASPVDAARATRGPAVVLPPSRPRPSVLTQRSRQAVQRHAMSHAADRADAPTIGPKRLGDESEPTGGGR